MVELDDLTSTLDNGEIGLPLPLGVAIPKRTVNASSVLNFTASEFEAVDSTEKGWPTLVIGTDEEADATLGVAIDYLGIWRDAPVQEVDIVLDSDQTWWAVVAFHTSEHAENHANYEVDGYAGCEFIDWPDYVDMDLEEDVVEEYIDEKITPIMYTADYPSYEAIAVQRAENVGTLTRMFNLERYGTLMDRKERLYRRVIPREERWEELDTDQVDQLRDVYQSVTDDEGDGAL